MAGTGCRRPHLSEGFYAAPVGTVPVDQDRLARLVSLSSNATAEIEKARQSEAQAQLRARADLIDALNDSHRQQIDQMAETHRHQSEHQKAALEEALAEVKDREERIRKLLSERHDDVGRLALANERAVSAEHRDRRLDLELQSNAKQMDLEALRAHLNAQLWQEGFRTAGSFLPHLPGLLGMSSAGSGENGPPSKTEILEQDPPPLCMALCHLLWGVRRRAVVARLEETLRALAEMPELHPLGLALMNEAPEAFQAVVLVLNQGAASSASNPAAQPAQPV
jgi:hypothetical protein